MLQFEKSGPLDRSDGFDLSAFWNYPDWSGGTCLRSGAEPFWMRAPLRPLPPKPANRTYAEHLAREWKPLPVDAETQEMIDHLRFLDQVAPLPTGPLIDF